MRVLILGAGGMLGHKLWQVCCERFETWGTVRSSFHEYARFGLFDRDRLLGGVDASDSYSIVRVFETVQPTVVINAIGVVKQLPTALDPIISLTVNSLFPHRLARLCEAMNARLFHISTDCVFSGRKGMYTEEDIPDPEDLYDRSKLLGEVSGPHCLTLRTSFIGRELKSTNGLVEWLLRNRNGVVQGYTDVIFSGLPTVTMVQIIADVIERYPDLSGVYHVSSEPISKYQLLCLLRDAFRVPVHIEPFPYRPIDRSLDSSRFRMATGHSPASWPELVQALARDPTPYEAWRMDHAS